MADHREGDESTGGEQVEKDDLDHLDEANELGSGIVSDKREEDEEVPDVQWTGTVVEVVPLHE